MTVHCPGCDSAIEVTARFCPACGFEVDPEATAAMRAIGASPPRPSSGAEGRFSAGQLLGERYRIVQRLGQGGMGEVYRADDLELGQAVALKFLPERLADDNLALDQLRGEVRLARSVSHANVCHVYDIGQADGHFFISMEYVDGEDLADALRRMGRPSQEKAAELARQICVGLAAAHEAGILHRDLKPANIMIDGRGRARITDFGLARLAEEQEDPHEFAGTPAYMAPEQLSDGRISVESDIYSLGLVLHELFTGRRVFETDSVEELRAHHASGPSTPSFADLDPGVERAVGRCLEADPGARPHSVYDVLALLPGGDPLAAALAAGETPSPQLVASARDSATMSPRVVALLVLWVVGSIIALSFIGGLTLRLPQRAPSELSIVAGEIATRELGLSELPPHDVSGMIRNPLHENDGVRPYAVWRRWSPRPIEPTDFHNPEASELFDPSYAHPGNIMIVLDDTGTLVKVSVILAPRPHDPTEETDLGPILARAAIDVKTVTAERVDPVRLDPPLPVYCDHVTVWRQKSSGKPVARAGVYAGRIVAFERVGHAPYWTPGQETPAGDLSGGLLNIAFLAMIFVAVRNLRLGRGDLRGALLTAVATFIAFLLVEAFAFDLDKSIIEQIMGLLGGRAGGHAVQHAAEIGTIYLAFEPIARRVWPRVLIGWARLIDGRPRDPRVGVEVLVGFAAACVVVLGLTAVPLFNSAGGRVLNDENLRFLNGPAATTAVALHLLTGSLFSSMYAVAFIGTGYVVTRRPRPALVVAAVLLSILYFGWGLSWNAYDYVLATFYGVAHGVIVTALFVRCGLVAVAAFLWLSDVLRVMVLTSDLSTWYTPYMIFTVLVVLIVLALGARAALTSRRPHGVSM